MRISDTVGGVTAAKGFQAASCAAGIKYRNRDDMAMICSLSPCVVAGTFTTNVVKAAPVLWDQARVADGKPVRAVVVNAGIANAATGETGLRLCRETAELTASLLGVEPSSVLLGSTGVIGPNLPMDRISEGVRMLVSSLSDTPEAGSAASRAIMTTDTVPKEKAVSFELPAADGSGTVTVRLGGMSKGSGMIHPNMSTMLAYITTDCDVHPDILRDITRRVVRDTFNMITVDGDTSTNDTLLVMANGQAGNAPIREAGEAARLLEDALRCVCRFLAIRMAGDGEGATHLIETRVLGADTEDHARLLAKSVVGSSLVKAMVFGRDANCGRILCALGYAGVDFNPAAVEVWMENDADRVCFYREGHVLSFDEDLALRILSGKAVRFLCDMRMGACEATAWGCDLTYDYVKINGDYRT